MAPNHFPFSFSFSNYAVVVFSVEPFFGDEVAWLSVSSTALAGAFAFPKGSLPCVSLNRMRIKPVMTQIQYRLYEMTEPYVAEFVQPRMALKIPQPF
jgi:hypothetical protein